MNVLRLHTHNGSAQEPFQNHVMIKEQKTTIDVDVIVATSLKEKESKCLPCCEWGFQSIDIALCKLCKSAGVNFVSFIMIVKTKQKIYVQTLW